ncbi:MAG: molybdopterin dehydrogenase FAD-binding protein [Acidimicrobiales bacterium]|nr:molybdopterin dehydrogenase FAD-binding protein [Acidimicrobiales bacterium]
MKCAPFRVELPSTVDEVVAALVEHGEDAKILAGGQSLIPMLAMRLARFDVLIDVHHVDGLASIQLDQNTIRIGSRVRQSEIERSDVIKRHLPVLAEATALIGHFQIRNRGTIGGSLVHADPAAEYPAVALALGATFEVTGPAGTRVIPAADFFLGYWTTALTDDEVLVAIHFPIPEGKRVGMTVKEVARRHGDFALAGAVASIGLDPSGAIVETAIALFSAADQPLRLTEMEAALTGHSPDSLDIPALSAAAAAGLAPGDDLHGSADFRRHLFRHLIADVAAEAITRAQEATNV